MCGATLHWPMAIVKGCRILDSLLAKPRQVAPFFLSSCEAAGINLTEDFNKPGGRLGAGFYHFTVRNGVRDSAARAMLGAIVMGTDSRANLDIRTSAPVNRILIESTPVS